MPLHELKFSSVFPHSSSSLELESIHGDILIGMLAQYHSAKALYIRELHILLLRYHL